MIIRKTENQKKIDTLQFWDLCGVVCARRMFHFIDAKRYGNLSNWKSITLNQLSLSSETLFATEVLYECHYYLNELNRLLILLIKQKKTSEFLKFEVF